MRGSPSLFVVFFDYTPPAGREPRRPHPLAADPGRPQIWSATGLPAGNHPEVIMLGTVLTGRQVGLAPATTISLVTRDQVG
jgi:hypothetical protein